MLKKCAKKGLGYIIIFFVTLFILFGMLVGAASIPKEKIQKNMESSAQYLNDGETYFALNENAESTVVDRYADSIRLLIAYNYDRENLLESVMWSSYYFKVGETATKCLYDSINYGYPPNKQYMRYWHGDEIFIILFHLIGNVQLMYIADAIIMAVLAVLLFVLLWKNKLKGGAIAFLIALISGTVWVTPFSLEYTDMMMLMLILTLAAVIFELKGKQFLLGPLFFIGGMAASFMDFLTVETLTITFPLLFVIYIRQRNIGFKKDDFKKSIGAVLLWFVGFILTWISKWLIASIVLGQNVMPYVTEHIAERLDGQLKESLSLLQYIYRAITTNLSTLFPFDFGSVGILISIGAIIFVFYLCFVHRNGNYNKKLIAVYFIIAAIPYIRYIVLHNHSYMHFHFTYRAQMATVLAVCLIVGEITKGGFIRHGTKKRRVA